MQGPSGGSVNFYWLGGRGGVLFQLCPISFSGAENTLGMEEVIELEGGYRGQKEKGSHDGL